MIFETQAMPLLLLLEARFDFIFVDAPTETKPGPQVLPVFEDEGPYYSWLGEDDAVKATVILLEKLEASHPYIVGVLGFSQGATVGAGLLFRDQRRRKLAMPSVGYCFGVFIGASSVPLLLDDDGNGSGINCSWHTSLDIPTMYVVGDGDRIALRGDELHNWVKRQPQAVSFTFDGGHEMPRRKEDVRYLTNYISRKFDESLGN